MTANVIGSLSDDLGGDTSECHSSLFKTVGKKYLDNKIKVFHLLIRAFRVLHVYGTKSKLKHHTSFLRLFIRITGVPSSESFYWFCS